jgi:hypothetical protein
MALNRLRFHNILVREMDAPSDAATELAEVVDEGIGDSTNALVTQQDFNFGLEVLRRELLNEIQGRFNSHLRMMIFMWASTMAAIIALAAAIIAGG